MRVFQRLSDIDEEFQAVKVIFNQYFHTLSPYYGNHVWNPTRVKGVAHLWWFTSGSVGKLLLCIAQRILLRWCPLLCVSRIWIATPLSTIKCGINCILGRGLDECVHQFKDLESKHNVYGLSCDRMVQTKCCVWGLRFRWTNKPIPWV
jgi:hypothetical protein